MVGVPHFRWYRSSQRLQWWWLVAMGISVTRTYLMAKLCTGKYKKAIPPLQLATGNVAVNSAIMSTFAIPNSTGRMHIHNSWGVYIRWTGLVEWNSGMDYWNGEMLHRTYLIIQHVLYNEQYPHHWKYQSLSWLLTEVL